MPGYAELQTPGVKAGEKFLRLGIRSVVDAPLAVAHQNRRCGLRRFQSRAADKDARSLQRFAVGFAGRGKGLVLAPSGEFRCFVSE